MGVWDLIRGHREGSPKAAPAAKGMPAAGARVPGVGDGRTAKKVKIKVEGVKKGGRHRGDTPKKK